MNEKQLLTLLNGAPFRKFTIAEQILLKKFAEVGRWITETGNPLSFLGKGARLLQHYIYSCSLQQNGTPTPTSPKPLICSNGAISYRNKITIDGTEYVLPADVQLVEYAKFDGVSTKVDTGLTEYKNTYKYLIGIKRYSTTTKFVSFQNPDNTKNNIGMFSNANGYNFQNGAGTRQQIDVNTTSFHDIVIERDGYTIDGNKQSVTPCADFTISNNLYIGCASNNSSIDTRYTEDAISYFAVINGTTTVYIGVPVYKANGDFAWLDLVSGTYSTITGTLTAGNKVAKEMITLGRTDNEFDKDANGTSCNGSLSYNGSISINGTSGTFKMPCEPNTQYTIGFVAELGTTIFRVATTQNEFVGTAMNTLDHYIGTTIKTYTFVTNANAHWLYMQTNSAKFDDVRDVLMLIKGSTVPTEYIPYWSLSGEKGKAKLNNILPLGYTQLEYIDNNNNAYLDLGMPIGSSDTAGPELPNGTIIDLPTIIKGNIDLVTGQGTEEWGIKVFDGTENWSLNAGVSGLFQVGIPTSLCQLSTPYLGLCSHYIVMQNKTASGIQSGECTFQGMNGSQYGRISIRDSRYVDYLEGFKKMLATQYANGTPMIVCFPKSTAIAISVTPVALRQKDGQNEASATLKELHGELSVTYYGE